MIQKFKKYLLSLKENASNYKKINLLLSSMSDDTKSSKIGIAQLQSKQNNQREFISNLSEVEFQVFSQGGEDGIIQYLISKIAIPNKTFIEFGVENYIESNSRFLFINNNWSGYVIDGSAENVRFIEHDLGSYGELHTTCSFITRDNINELLVKVGFDSEVGLLSIDIDGNDYWVWQAIKSIKPIIVIAEYNSVFGVNTFWSIPYQADFVRKNNNAHQLYYGASLQALNYLAEQKGYSFIGCNTKGNNAFFLRKDKLGSFIRRTTVEEGYVESKFREARDTNGWISSKNRIKAIAGLDVVDVRTDNLVKILPEDVKYYKL
jgi:hypothetical protein